ncbi:PAS domain S-box-containing protein [Pedobacter nutrimenti]|uniref:histidine kinase n=2 Tax=Pedobacter nutrimenti TaxID=1241337 RepID=A0A318UKF4_9SPHI|nr:PAS domain S-box-containing protein [Pedobacter nutrimenti]
MHTAADPTRLIRMIEEIDDYAILFLDRDGTIESWNKGAQEIKGYRADEVIGQNFSIFYTPEDLLGRKPEKLMDTAMKLGKASDEGWRVGKDGIRFWGSISIKAIYDEGELIGFSKITRDLTDKFNIENAVSKYARELELRNKELEHFAYVASHDLQEPLLTVTSFIELLKEEYAERLDENAEMYLNFIKQSSERMRSMIKGLLDYSRLGRKLEIAEVDCNVLMKEIKEDLFINIKLGHATIIYENLPVVKGYAIELRQLFQNLISNALKFRNEGTDPVVVISAFKIKGGWKFSVKDNGIGIEERFRDKIFSIFQRLHSRMDYEGNGIGLAHCKKIVELHGGEISLESLPGVGSTFYFNLNTDS